MATTAQDLIADYEANGPKRQASGDKKTCALIFHLSTLGGAYAPDPVAVRAVLRWALKHGFSLPDNPRYQKNIATYREIELEIFDDRLPSISGEP